MRNTQVEILQATKPLSNGRGRRRAGVQIDRIRVQGYVKDPKKNIPNLIEYAKVLRVQTRVKELIGVWL